jgi:hypothetical protein
MGSVWGVMHSYLKSVALMTLPAKKVIPPSAPYQKALSFYKNGPGNYNMSCNLIDGEAIVCLNERKNT